MTPMSIGEPWMWAAFIVIAWASLALIFAALLWWYLNGTLGAEIAQRKTLEFLTGYKGIVNGSHGLGATEALLLGSVAYKVIHLSKASVLVVR